MYKKLTAIKSNGEYAIKASLLRSSIITIAVCVLWTLLCLMVWRFFWSWIDSQAPDIKDIKPFILIILAGYYICQGLPCIINELNRSVVKKYKRDLRNTINTKENLR